MKRSKRYKALLKSKNKEKISVKDIELLKNNSNVKFDEL